MSFIYRSTSHSWFVAAGLFSWQPKVVFSASHFLHITVKMTHWEFGGNEVPKREGFWARTTFGVKFSLCFSNTEVKLMQRPSIRQQMDHFRQDDFSCDYVPELYWQAGREGAPHMSWSTLLRIKWTPLYFRWKCEEGKKLMRQSKLIELLEGEGEKNNWCIYNY